MATYEADMKVRPSAWWYLLPVGIWIACIVLAVIAFKPFIDLVDHGVDPVRNGDQITVTDDGLTVYATGAQTPRNCRLVDTSGNATALDAFDDSFDLELPDGANYFALASTPDGFDAGTYTLECRGIGANGELGTGLRLDIGAIGQRLVIGILIPIVAGIIGLVILIVLLVKRHNSKSRIKAMRSSGGGYGGGPTGGYGSDAPGGYGSSPPGGYGTSPPGGYGTTPPTDPGAYPPPPPADPPR
jgi:hypothetical protein